ncbi:MAG: ABC transporter permease [Candidatus Thermoplasmatota archaeon]|jgi:ABC-2 type transport system permease protein|nr:ABC transporter permease [Candidatus Thermoplasmatota archaeon]
MNTNFLPSWKGLWAFAGTEARVQLHEYLSIATTVLVQMIFIFFVWLLAPPQLLPFAVVGSMVFSSFVVGERVLDEAAYIRIDHKLNELYHASPLTPESYFLGMGMGVLAAYLPPLVVLGVLSELVHPFTVLSLGVLVGTLALVWLIAASLGYVLSTFFIDMRAIWPYATLLFNFFGVLPPVFYPLGLFPSYLTEFALLLPPSAGAALVVHAMGLEPLSGGEIVLALTALLVEALLLSSFAIYWARKRTREGV